ncbi:Dom3Z protein [Daphnia magna]|uniref:Dom3Z protein n=1 Tax=Daphnia magna TaxID=35525 RepID=A0A164HXW6_9CRUS|nr:Dom3Z protein [Daphnia magna]
MNFCLRFKSMKWWAQSFIVGIPKIVVGYRDDDVRYLPMDFAEQFG